MVDLGSPFRKGELEAPMAEPDQPAPLAGRLDALERAQQAELTESASLNGRGTALAAASALSILLLAQFAGVWLDEGRWKLSRPYDWIQQDILLPGSVGALLLCLLLACVVVWPRRRAGSELKGRLERVGQGGAADEEEARLLLTVVDAQRIANERKSRFLRLASIPLVLAVGLVVAQSMIFAFDAQSVDAPRSDQPGLAPTRSLTGLPKPGLQQRLADLYAPLVYLHSDERWGPADPAAFIEASTLDWNRSRHDAEIAGRGEVDPARLGAACDAEPEGCYSFGGYLSRELTRPFLNRPERPIDLQNAEDRGFFLDPDSSARGGDLTDTPDQSVFYEFRATGAGVAISYWLFYGYSRPRAGRVAETFLGEEISHEGDWENIDVVLNPELTRPLAVFFYGHGHPQRRAWEDVCKLVDETEDCRSSRAGHPIVYSALGSHASYPGAGETEVCAAAGCACDIREPERGWATWEAAAGVRPVQEEPWYGFGGAWGYVGNFDSGPLGPSVWKLPSDLDPGDLESEAKPC
ncbi:MAG: hypothetical protein ACRDKX_03005 [Solirubrobacterales bacterium]